jgi:hypothetical protein
MKQPQHAIAENFMLATLDTGDNMNAWYFVLADRVAPGMIAVSAVAAVVAAFHLFTTF